MEKIKSLVFTIKANKDLFFVLKHSSRSLFLKIVGVLIGLFVNMKLGQLLGPIGFGNINLALQYANVLLIIALLGIPNVLTRQIAQIRVKSNSFESDKLIMTSFALVCMSVAFFIIINYSIKETISNLFYHKSSFHNLITVSVVAIFFQGVSRIMQAILIANEKIWQSNLVDQVLSMAIVAILIISFEFLEISMTALHAVYFYAIGRIVVTIFISYLSKNYFKIAKIDLGSLKFLTKTSYPLLLVSVSLIISSSIDSIMLGILSNSKEVGLYNAAAKITLLSIFFLQAAISALSPKIVELYQKGEELRLKSLIQKITGTLIIIGAACLILFIILGKSILSLFGAEFIEAYPTLVILSVGQFFNIASGPVGNLLIMTNHDKTLQRITLITLVLNIILNYLFIQLYGSLGAAIATTITIFLNMTYSWFFVKKKLNFSTIPFL
ncbi:flippase [Lacihabitans lacunae]|uniref:Flippase n=1 Tax=Lacihabitans lacunae TaxID=1028214 RepID=A0ABV7YQ49_9BACT